MIKNEDTYCIVQHKIVRELGAWEAVVYGTIANLLRKTGGYGNVSNDILIELIGRDKKSIYRWIDSLVKAGYLEKVGGKGRGNISIYYVTKKGGNMTPFKEEKRGQNDTEKGANMTEKGGEMPPINKGINKEIKEREVTPTPISNPNEKIFMKDFETWWSKYPGDPDYSYDKENCEKVWSLMQPEWREKLVTMAERGIRWRTKQNDKPIFYLRDYVGQDAQMELPFVRQGSKTFAKWIDEHEHKDVICLFRYEGSLAYCLEDAKQMMIDAGAEFIRSWI